jgi:hypothetical protein
MIFIYIISIISISFGNIDCSTLSVENWVTRKLVQGGWRMMHLIMLPHVQTQSTRVCNFQSDH